MKGKKFNKDKKGFDKKEKISKGPRLELAIEKISSELKGKNVLLTGFIDRIAQTPGPTVFYLVDGTGTLALKAFAGPGARAYEEIEEGNAIRASVSIEEFKDELEGEIIDIVKISEDERKALLKKISDMERDRARIDPPKFLVKSPILDKLRDSFIKAATEIRLAIIQNRPIIVRHHNDADGYSSGYSLEKAILPLIEKQHGGGKSAWEFYTRAPCSAPFYEIDDSIRDTANSLRNVAKFSNKMPLVIIADNGSSQEDLFGIKQGKVHGMDFIVIDHHFFEKDVITPEVLVHINPFLVGEDGAKYSAGMLCSELARFIYDKVDNVESIAAMAGLADRIDNPEVMQSYLSLAEKKGYSKKMLGEIATVIDFVSAKLRFMEAREYIEVLFGEPMDKQKDLVSLMSPYIRNLENKGLKIAISNSKIEKIGKTSLQSMEIEETFPGFGFYPKPGKVVGLLHDHARDEKKISSLVTVGLMSSAITIRATDEANFSVHDLITTLNSKLPDAFVEGGGHKNAGSITFLPYKKKEVFEILKSFIRSRN